MEIAIKDIDNFFYPHSVCLVGASTKEKSIGYELLKTILNYNYKGKIFPVNPKATEILGLKCYKSILEINNKIDLAIIVVPKPFVENSIDELILKGVKSIILITAGFKETGKEGELAEKRILKKIRENNIRLIGPNCMGVINTLDNIKLNATFVAEKPEEGSIGFLSQSGALGAAVLNSLRETNIKFAHFISVGNKADINENDILEYWHKDKNIKVLTFYLESFENGIDFLTKYSKQKIKKPVIILKAGKTESGMKAASSHTGALSSNDRIVNALLKQFGIIRAANLNELFNTAKGFEYFPIPKGNKVAVVTNAGGPAILTVDKLEERKLELASFSERTINKLKEIVHPQGSVNNPVDLLPGGSAETYKKVNEIILQDDNVDTIVSIFVEPVMVDAFEVIEAVNSINSTKPVFQVCMPLPEFWKKYNKNSKIKTPIFKQPEDPAEIISNMLLYQNRIINGTINIGIISDNRKSLTATSGKYLSQFEVEKVCRLYSIPIVENKFLTLEEIKKNTNYTFPVVIKGLSDSVIHKTEANAVKLNVKNKDELIHYALEIKENFKKIGAEINKYLIQPYIKTKHELVIGGFRDYSFGPTIMFGLGGKYIEVFNDTSIRSAYINEADIDDMIDETKIGKILAGVRGENSVDIIELKRIIKSVARMLIENENIMELDLNPVIVAESNNFFAVDVRLKVLK